MKASSVILDALKDIDNTGTLEAEKKMTLHAGQDIRMTTGTHREENGQGHTTAISKRGAASVTGKEGSLTMTAGKDIHLQAARISSAGDMTIAGKRQVELGTAVAEKDNRVTWDRSNDRRDSTAAENRKTTEGNSRSKGAGITASFGIGGLQNVGISAGKSKGNMEEEIITHTGSAVTAKETLAMESGKDIDIKGSKAGGKKVEVKTGNNLSIESLQDSHTYHSRDKESGIHLQRDITARPDTGKKKMDDPYFSIGKKTETTDSTYTSVTKQAGIYAGKEGYDIQVKNNTRLKGAVIDSQAEKEKNRITTGTLTWENIDNKAEYKTGGHGISYNGKIGRGDKNDPLDSQTNNRYGKDPVTGQRNGMNKITQTIYGSKIPLNERGLLNIPIPSVKGKAGTTTTSAVSQGTITITDKENQKQDIEKLNRNTEDSLNKLKEIFEKTKVEERKRLLEELGIVGNRAIHEIASHNGWKDGSAEKAALHGMLGAKSGGSALSGLIAGGANEYAIGYLKKTKGKDWIAKHPDTVQNISAAFGGILSKMTGGNGHTGAYISQMGTKWNELDEEMEAREAVKEIIEKEVWNQIENSKESTAKEVMRKAHYLVDKGIIDPTNMIGDYVSTQLSLGEGLKAGAVGCIIDKEGNVYATLAFAPGGTVGVPLGDWIWIPQ
ncbi:hemagglutinin repeat-containing protein [Dialister invisus]|uniref:hemagglutinin repeat-containing protein n=1 Tax=Dialister invisus TaxID=218538 RepID=UPI0026DB373D|nr:hemagglutinin repeat-containing protein [Dialister invisus]